MVLELLSGATATNSAPSGATAGKPTKRTAEGQLTGQGFLDTHNKFLLIVWDTAGSGTMTCTLRLWGYISSYAKSGAGVTVARWMPLGVGADSTKGTINAGAGLGETASNDIGHCEVVENLARFDRLYLEVVAIDGTATAISAALLPLGSD